MHKKIIIIIIISLLFLTACETYNLNDMSLEKSIDIAISSNAELYNINNKGYRYYLPRGFIVKEDRDNIQILNSNGIEYFLNVDLISYYNEVEISKDINNTLYKYYNINYDGKSGFLEIVENNDYFLIKMVYNYAIIEAQVKESEIKTVAMNMAYIVSSVKYNDYVINNKFGEDILDLNETTYKIFGPNRETDTKSYAYYLEQYNEYTGDINIETLDPDVIEN